MSGYYIDQMQPYSNKLYKYAFQGALLLATGSLIGIGLALKNASPNENINHAGVGLIGLGLVLTTGTGFYIIQNACKAKKNEQEALPFWQARSIVRDKQEPVQSP